MTLWCATNKTRPRTVSANFSLPYIVIIVPKTVNLFNCEFIVKRTTIYRGLTVPPVTLLLKFSRQKDLLDNQHSNVNDTWYHSNCMFLGDQGKDTDKNDWFDVLFQCLIMVVGMVLVMWWWCMIGGGSPFCENEMGLRTFRWWTVFIYLFQHKISML